MAAGSDGAVLSASALATRISSVDRTASAPPAGEHHPLLVLTIKALLVGFTCYLSTETVALNLPPLFVSPVWPTNSILLCALVATPIRHWWVYALAAFVSSVHHNANTGAPVSQILLFLTADAIEVGSVAVGVRKFAGGLGAFENPRNLAAYLILIAATPFVSAFVASLAALGDAHWTLWRSWFLTDVFGYVTLAPAILTWISPPRRPWSSSRMRN